jgi:hypothetical protein
MAEYTLSDFNQDLARKGASVGYMDSNNKIHIATETSFYINTKTNFIGFVRFVDDYYEFLFDGSFYIGFKKQYLKIVSTTITKTTGTKLVRKTSSDGTSNARPFPRNGIATASETGGTEESDKEEEIFSIATLQPREEVAASCLQAMLQKYENPLNIDNTKIKQLVSKSYLFAQEFINQAVLYREKETTSITVENNKYASVDSDFLSSDTDKLLYNIATAINNFIAQDKNQYADQQKNGLKLAATDVNVKTLPESININAAVTGSVTTKQESTSSGT